MLQDMTPPQKHEPTFDNILQDEKYFQNTDDRNSRLQSNKIVTVIKILLSVPIKTRRWLYFL